MDANGQSFWLLAGARQFPALHNVVWDAACGGGSGALRLASQRLLRPLLAPAEAFAAAQGALASVPRAVDAVDSVARWDAAAGAVVVQTRLADGNLLPEVVLLTLAEAPSDLCVGADGVLYVALVAGVRLHDLRGRFADVTVTLAGYAPWRLAPAADGGVWLLERNSDRLARLQGRPRREPAPQPDDYDGRVFRPSPENGCAPQIRVLAAGWSGSERVLGLAAGPDGALAVLGWRDGEGTAVLRRWSPEQARFEAPLRLQGAAYAYALAWLAPDRVAVRVPGLPDAPAFDLSTALAGAVLPLGEVYPLPAAAVAAPFCNGIAQPPLVPVGQAGGVPLHALSINHLARRGEAANAHPPGSAAAEAAAWLVDSGKPTTVWHRVYAECQLPAQTGFVLWLAATNEAQPPARDDVTAWHPHGFGRDIDRLDAAMAAPQLPHAAWHREPSELPGHPGLLGASFKNAGNPAAESVAEIASDPASNPPHRPGEGLFSVLVQNSRQRVRSLVGRYLWLRLVLHGDGRVGPEIAALRAWGSRFSYADQYLPRLYRESLFGDEASAPGERLGGIERSLAPLLDAGGPPSASLRARLALLSVAVGEQALLRVEQTGQAWLLRDGTLAWRLLREPSAIGVYRPQATPADFNARLLANFESVLTPLEDRIAAAHLFSNPASVPEPQLDWLAGWIGVAFDAALPAACRRDWLRAAPDLARRHGSRDGLRLALDIATGGAVRSGAVVVVEDFRLRRLLATLLGVDLVNAHDPLLPGLQVSGNSVIGDTLFVGDAPRAELLALFADAASTDAVSTEAEDDAVLAFDTRLAHRATVLVHQALAAQDLALIRRIARLEAPAHVLVRVLPATWPLLVGVASLVGVDTFLAPPRAPRQVQLQRSVLGGGDVLQVQPLLDPRLSGVPSAARPPVADAGVDRAWASTATLVLDASDSRAAPGRRITEYRWRWLPPEET
jgi:phage tail-like protein